MAEENKVVAPVDKVQKTKKRNLIIALAGGGALLVACIVALVVMFCLVPNYEEAYRAANELDDIATEVASGDGSCADVLLYMDWDDADNAEYAEFVATCTGHAEQMLALTDKLGGMSAVKGNDALKAEYEDLRSKLAVIVPDMGTFEARMAMMTDFHTFYLERDDLDVSESTEAEIKETASALTNSSNETLKTMGERWVSLATAYLNAYKAYWDSDNWTTDGTYDRMSEARDAMYDWDDEALAEIEAQTKISYDNLSELGEAAWDLYSEAYDAYAESV